MPKQMKDSYSTGICVQEELVKRGHTIGVGTNRA